MKTHWRILFALLLSLAIVSAIWYKNQTKVFIAKEESCQYALERFSTLHQVISSVGQIPYDSDFANCYDHSKLMTQKLAENNIRSSIMVNEDRSHSWVAVWIEATTGQFVPIEGGEQNVLEIRDGINPAVVQCYNK